MTPVNFRDGHNPEGLKVPLPQTRESLPRPLGSSKISRARVQRSFSSPSVSRYDDIIHVVEHPETFSSRPTVPNPPDFILEKFVGKVSPKGTLLGWDNPDHDRLRKSVASFFVPRRLARFEPMIERLANRILDDCTSEGSVDIKSRFALPLPLKVISEIAGLDSLRWEWVARSLALFGGHADFNVGTLGAENPRDLGSTRIYR